MEFSEASKSEQSDPQLEPPVGRVEPEAEAERPHPLLQIQKALGNRAVGRLVQASLHVSQPGDAHEQEAERVSEQLLQSSPGEGEPEAPRPARETQGDGGAQAGGGAPLPDATREFFEPRMGLDLSSVRVHTDAEAADSASAIRARAYTVGQDIVFGPNQFNPDSGGGLRLLAHELVHVAQQSEQGETEGAQAVARAPLGLYAAPGDGQEFGSQLGWRPPGMTGSSSVGFDLPPLKISRELVFYLIANGLLSEELKGMLLRGEIVLDEPADAPLAGTGDAPQGSRLGPELSWLRMRVEEREGSGAPAAATLYPGLTPPAPGQQPDADDPAEPVPSPGVNKDKKDWYKFHWTKGLDFPTAPLAPNVFITGVTLQLLHKGQLGVETKIGWTATVDVHISYKKVHLLVSIDRFGNWEARLSGPTNNPTPTIDRLKDIFSQGAGAVETVARTVKAGVPNPGELGAVKDRLATVADPLKYAIDAALGIADAPAIPGAPAAAPDQARPVADTGPQMSWSVVAGAGPGPGKLPESIPKGIPPASDVKTGFYGGINFTLVF